tara:strand:- start:23 stop:226 length:204 start_codon:yes stop_codon:yes gene_type:complete
MSECDACARSTLTLPKVTVIFILVWQVGMGVSGILVLWKQTGYLFEGFDYLVAVVGFFLRLADLEHS